MRYISIVCACIVKNCKIVRFGLWKDVPVAYRIHWSMCWILKPVLLILIRKDPLNVLDLGIRTDPHHFDGSGFATSLEEMDLDPRWTYYFGVLGLFQYQFLELLKNTTSGSTKGTKPTLTPFMYPQGITELLPCV